MASVVSPTWPVSMVLATLVDLWTSLPRRHSLVSSQYFISIHASGSDWARFVCCQDKKKKVCVSKWFVHSRHWACKLLFSDSGDLSGVAAENYTYLHLCSGRDCSGGKGVALKKKSQLSAKWNGAINQNEPRRIITNETHEISTHCVSSDLASIYRGLFIPNQPLQGAELGMLGHAHTHYHQPTHTQHTHAHTAHLPHAHIHLALGLNVYIYS